MVYILTCPFSLFAMLLDVSLIYFHVMFISLQTPSLPLMLYTTLLILLFIPGLTLKAMQLSVVHELHVVHGCDLILILSLKPSKTPESTRFIAIRCGL